MPSQVEGGSEADADEGGVAQVEDDGVHAVGGDSAGHVVVGHGARVDRRLEARPQLVAVAQAPMRAIAITIWTTPRCSEVVAHGAHVGVPHVQKDVNNGAWA